MEHARSDSEVPLIQTPVKRRNINVELKQKGHMLRREAYQLTWTVQKDTYFENIDSFVKKNLNKVECAVHSLSLHPILCPSAIVMLCHLHTSSHC